MIGIDDQGPASRALNLSRCEQAQALFAVFLLSVTCVILCLSLGLSFIPEVLFVFLSRILLQPGRDNRVVNLNRCANSCLLASIIILLVQVRRGGKELAWNIIGYPLLVQTACCLRLFSSCGWFEAARLQLIARYYIPYIYSNIFFTAYVASDLDICKRWLLSIALMSDMLDFARRQRDDFCSPDQDFDLAASSRLNTNRWRVDSPEFLNFLIYGQLQPARNDKRQTYSEWLLGVVFPFVLERHEIVRYKIHHSLAHRSFSIVVYAQSQLVLFMSPQARVAITIEVAETGLGKLRRVCGECYSGSRRALFGAGQVGVESAQVVQGQGRRLAHGSPEWGDKAAAML